MAKQHTKNILKNCKTSKTQTSMQTCRKIKQCKNTTKLANPKKSKIVLHKPTAPKNGVECCQKPIGGLSCSPAMFYNDWLCQPTSIRQTGADR